MEIEGRINEGKRWKNCGNSTFHIAEIEHSLTLLELRKLTFKIAEIEPSYFQLSALTQIFEKLI